MGRIGVDRGADVSSAIGDGEHEEEDEGEVADKEESGGSAAEQDGVGKREDTDEAASAVGRAEEIVGEGARTAECSGMV